MRHLSVYGVTAGRPRAGYFQRGFVILFQVALPSGSCHESWSPCLGHIHAQRQPAQRWNPKRIQHLGQHPPCPTRIWPVQCPHPCFTPNTLLPAVSGRYGQQFMNWLDRVAMPAGTRRLWLLFECHKWGWICSKLPSGPRVSGRSIVRLPHHLDLGLSQLRRADCEVLAMPAWPVNNRRQQVANCDS